MLRGNRWKIVELLTKGNKTPTELAKTLKISPASLHRHLVYLKQEKIIKEVGQKKGKTRPFAEYSIGEGFVYFTKVLPGEAEQRFLTVDENLKLHLRIWSIPQQKYHYFIEIFWWNIQEYLEDIDSIIIYGSVARGDARKESDIDILLLVKKDVEKYERLFGARVIGPKGKGKMIMAQVFETDDFKNSLKLGSKFAEEVLKNFKVIYDPNGAFIKIHT